MFEHQIVHAALTMLLEMPQILSPTMFLPPSIASKWLGSRGLAMPMSMVSCARSCLCRRYLQHPSLLRHEHWRASEHRTFVHVNTFPDLVRKRT